jgi:hypothetical protein
VSVTVGSRDRRFVDAFDRRLRSFAASAPSRADVRIEFLEPTEWPGPLNSPGGENRPVLCSAAGAEIAYFPGPDVLYGDADGVRVLCEAGTGKVRLAGRELSGRALYLAVHPLATISLIELFKRHGRFPVHAACLADGDRAVLLAGPGGSGKSTLALALALGPATLSLVSDDTSLLVRHGDGVEVLGFPDLVGMTADTAALFPTLVGSEAVPAPGFPKHLVRTEEICATPVTAHYTPVALVFPEVVAGSPGRLLGLDRRGALLRLLKDVLLTEPAATQAHLDAVSALVARVSCHRLEIGRDLTRAARVVRDLL